LNSGQSSTPVRKDGCSLATYRQVVTDFNEWGRGYGYKAEILVPSQRANLETM
jgi:hypothetical protein